MNEELNVMQFNVIAVGFCNAALINVTLLTCLTKNIITVDY